MAQNYPNPFNPNTSIEFYLAERSYVRLEVFDLLGRRVRTLIKGVAAAGRHQIAWDGKTDRGGQASSGVYLYRMTAGRYSESRKMILLK